MPVLTPDLCNVDASYQCLADFAISFEIEYSAGSSWPGHHPSGVRVLSWCLDQIRPSSAPRCIGASFDTPEHDVQVARAGLAALGQ
jgi:hypothetical protein